MKVATTKADLRAARSELAIVGFVPTMGFLHEGHLSLVRNARARGDAVVVSIFVNPSQFNDPADLAAYPRDEARDLAMLREAGVDLVFLPSADEIYPDGFWTRIEVGDIATRLEGAARPGHFSGVATVVAKLFNLVQPDRAYFGQKDAQQVRVVQQMVCDLDMPIEIVACPTVREADGLARSSRNARLTPDARRIAAAIPAALREAHERYRAGERDAERLRTLVVTGLKAMPAATLDYVSIADSRSLHELTEASDGALLSLAVKLGSVRLIDNIVLGLDHREFVDCSS